MNGEWLPLEALIWLFPVAFVIHDLEEIITVEKWVASHANTVRSKLPERLADRVLKQFEMTTAQFAVAVLVVFLFVGSSAYLAYQSTSGGPLGTIRPFLVCNLLFFIHLFTHVAQSFYFRSVTPGAVTSVLVVLPYSLLLFRSLFDNRFVDWQMLFECLPFIVLALPVVLFAQWTGKKLA
ncbi:HXXEE domain-containing protein [Cohnella lubricantis]|uniref:HXXEE domain-containing protein n=1 Tax=Cohnella lubricantis TaxID=2163172 RepID=A0A841TA67_9BACL|nr:HXXEE domain-containing protein [Cohnella lubricantis]MBB6678194.1 HXXEE domain-containing protein [Cohnella lubricantis]MBP2119679.1 hypothetical protein [Cohnella lubricantis]